MLEHLPAITDQTNYAETVFSSKLVFRGSLNNIGYHYVGNQDVRHIHVNSLHCKKKIREI